MLAVVVAIVAVVVVVVVVVVVLCVVMLARSAWFIAVSRTARRLARRGNTTKRL